MIGDVGEHMAQPGLGVDTVELGGAKQGVNRSDTLATAVGADEQAVAPTGGAPAQGPFGGQVVDFDQTVVAAAQQRGPQIHGVLDRPGRVRLTRQLFSTGAQPAF